MTIRFLTNCEVEANSAARTFTPGETVRIADPDVANTLISWRLAVPAESAGRRPGGEFPRQGGRSPVAAVRLDGGAARQGSAL